MERFCVYRPRVAFGILLLLILAVAVVFALLQMPLWLTLVETLCLFLGGWGYIITRPATWVERAIKIRNEQCDPYPLAQVCEEMCAITRNPVSKQIFMINMTVAYSDMGQYERCIEIMQASGGEAMLSLQRLPGRVVYYNNLASFYTDLNRLDEAGEALQKAMDLWSTLKNPKLVEQLGRALHDKKTALALARGDYSTAISLLGGVSEDNARALVNKHLLRAKVHLALGEQEAARISLQYVIANANRLHARVEAEELLATLNA